MFKLTIFAMDGRRCRQVVGVDAVCDGEDRPGGYSPSPLRRWRSMAGAEVDEKPPLGRVGCSLLLLIT